MTDGRLSAITAQLSIHEPTGVYTYTAALRAYKY